MGTTSQIRGPAQAAAQVSSPAEGKPSTFTAFLSVRIWASSESGPLLWESGAAAVCLAADLIAASEGAQVSSQGGVLVAGFPSIQPAVSTARRLQWAVQGFSEAEDLRGTSVAVLVHSADDISSETGGGGVQDALEQTGPGQILLTGKASQLFEDLPGFSMQAIEGSGLRELLWRHPESQSSRSADDRFITQTIRQQGLEDELFIEPEQPVTPDEDLFLEADSGTPVPVRPGLLRRRSTWLIAGGCAAAFLLGAVAIYHPAKDEPRPAPKAPAPSAMTTPPAAPAVHPAAEIPKSPSSTAASPAQTVPETPVERPKRPERKPQPPTEAVVPKPEPKPPEPPRERPGGKCDLEPDEISGTIDRAEKSFGRGQYSAALRQFGAVVECEPGNGRAREGLERVRRAMAAEGGHDN